MVQSKEIISLILSKTNTEKVFTYPGSPPRYLYEKINESETDLIQTVREQHILTMAQTYYYNQLEEGEERVPVAIVSGEMGEGMALQPLISGSISSPCLIIVAEEKFKHVNNATNIAHQSQRGKTPRKLGNGRELLAKHDNIEKRILLDSEERFNDLENLLESIKHNKSVGVVHIPLYALEDYENKLDEEFQKELTKARGNYNVSEIKEKISDSEKPILIVGRGMRNKTEEVSKLAETIGAPIITTMQMEGVFENNYLGRIGTMGTPVANEAFFQSDIAIALGTSINNLITSYNPEIIREFREKVYQIELNSQRKSIFAKGHIDQDYDTLFETLGQIKDENWFVEPKNNSNEERKKQIPPAVNELSNHIKENWSDKIVNLGVGNHMVWMSYSLGPEIRKEVSRSGSMGEAVAGIESEENPVIVLGDGEFEMDLSIITEAYYQNKRPNIFVINNERLGMVTEKQEAEFDNFLTPKEQNLISYENFEEIFPEMRSYSADNTSELKEVLRNLEKEKFNVVEIKVEKKMSPKLIDIEDLPRIKEN